MTAPAAHADWLSTAIPEDDAVGGVGKCCYLVKIVIVVRIGSIRKQCANKDACARRAYSMN